RPGPGLEVIEGRALPSVVPLGSAVSSNGVADLAPGAPAPAEASLSADGRYMAFASPSTDLVDGVQDTNNASDVFVRDQQAGKTTLVSASPDGKAGDGRSFQPVISPDGRYVAFLSTATDLVPGSREGAKTKDPSAATGGVLYLRDLQTGTTTRLDATPDGQPSDGTCSGTFVFSPDSRYLAFVDNSTNLTANPAPAQGSASAAPYNVFVRDLAAGTTSLVSVTTDGQPSSGSGLGSDLAFSPDGRRLAFTSTDARLTPNALDTAGNPPASPPNNLYVRDLVAGTTTAVSVTADGKLSNGNASGPLFSSDGRSITFTSTATDLAATSPSGGPGAASNGNLYLRDLASGTTSPVTVLAAQAQHSDAGAPVAASTTGAPPSAPGQVQFAATQFDAKEGDGVATVTITRTGPADGSASVRYEVQDDSARAGVEFSPTSGTLTFGPGETSKTIAIPLNRHLHFPGTRTARLVLSDPQGVDLGTAAATLSLTSDAPPPASTTPPPDNPPW
ncbi:MAG: PD40 domain-containing protein, partial [Isosphaeraceae bacterium]|nr:PD40 domain-containing protein [Isosphaeraceae bacterium]